MLLLLSNVTAIGWYHCQSRDLLYYKSVMYRKWHLTFYICSLKEAPFYGLFNIAWMEVVSVADASVQTILYRLTSESCDIPNVDEKTTQRYVISKTVQVDSSKSAPIDLCKKCRYITLQISLRFVVQLKLCNSIYCTNPLAPILKNRYTTTSIFVFKFLRLLENVT